MKYGEYIRTISGDIYKYDETIQYILDCDLFYNRIVKHSKNITDLIQCGDYVNGDEVIPVDYEEDKKHNYFDILGVYCIEDDYAYTIRLTDMNIKTILTKELFEQNSYKIGE